MTTIVNRESLISFIDRKLLLIESTPIPDDMRALGQEDGMSEEDIRALWVGAGIASQIGMALALEPGPFVTTWPEEGEV
jgi:hypothetical protein